MAKVVEGLSTLCPPRLFGIGDRCHGQSVDNPASRSASIRRGISVNVAGGLRVAKGQFLTALDTDRTSPFSCEVGLDRLRTEHRALPSWSAVSTPDGTSPDSRRRAGPHGPAPNIALFMPRRSAGTWSTMVLRAAAPRPQEEIEKGDVLLCRTTTMTPRAREPSSPEHRQAAASAGPPVRVPRRALQGRRGDHRRVFHEPSFWPLDLGRCRTLAIRLDWGAAPLGA